jgi:hypothetical protein
MYSDIFIGYFEFFLYSYVIMKLQSSILMHCVAILFMYALPSHVQHTLKDLKFEFQNFKTLRFFQLNVPI